MQINNTQTSLILWLTDHAPRSKGINPFLVFIFPPQTPSSVFRRRSDFDHSFITKFCPRRFDKFEFIPSMGASGGAFMIIWNSSSFTGHVLHRERFSLSIQFTSTQLNKTWTLTNVYGTCTVPGKQLFLDWLKNLEIPLYSLWLFLRDFNLRTSEEKQNKPDGNYKEMMQFNEMISQQALVELPLKGQQFTWSNMQQQPLLEQLD
jgi:hypothetical protein